MNRRSFLKRFAVAAAGLSLGASLLSESLTAKPVGAAKGIKFDPIKYKGDWEWIVDGLRQSTQEVWMNRYRAEYLKLAT